MPSTSSSSESEVSERGMDVVVLRAEQAVVWEKLLTGRGFGAILDRSLGREIERMVSDDGRSRCQGDVRDSWMHQYGCLCRPC